jgi:zona occludens toxin (predicted ATPase)
MLRLFALLLLLANGLFFAWSKNYLSPWGFAPVANHESFRLAEQIEPERIVIKQNDATPEPTATTTVSSAASVPAPAPAATPTQVMAATTCLTAGAFNDRQSTALKQTLSTKLPELRWRFDMASVPARWIVYMGKYPNDNARDLKKKQLDQIKVRYELLTEGNLEPGLSLGSHASQAAANQALQQLVKQGVRTARVLQESPEQKAQTLVVPTVDDATRVKLDTVYATIAGQLANKALQVCK